MVRQKILASTLAVSDSSEGRVQITLAPTRLARWLGLTVLLLTVASLVVELLRQLGGYGDLFGVRPVLDVGSDISLPTWYSSFALLLCALLLGLIARAKQVRGGAYVGHWYGLGAIFLLFSIDETAGIHERMGHSVTRVLGTTGLFYYGWVVLGLLAVVVVGAVYLRFLLHLPPTTRILFIVAAALFVGGGIGVEMLNARIDYLYGIDNLAATLLTAVEELLEMAGVVVFAYALLEYLRELNIVLRVDFADERAPGA